MICPDCGTDCGVKYWQLPFSEYFGPPRIIKGAPIAKNPMLVRDWAGFGDPEPFPAQGYSDPRLDGLRLTWRDTTGTRSSISTLNSCVVFNEGDPEPVAQIGSIASGGRQMGGSTWVRPDLRRRGINRALYVHNYRWASVVCASFAPYRRILFHQAAAAAVAKAYRLAVEWAIRDGEDVPVSVRETYMAETEEWIMASKEQEQQLKARRKLKALQTKAAAASKAGTPTWVDRIAGKLTTVPPSERRADERAHFAARTKAKREEAKPATETAGGAQ